MTFLLTPLSVKSKAEVAYSKRWFLTPCSSTRLSHTCPPRPSRRRKRNKRNTAMARQHQSEEEAQKECLFRHKCRSTCVLKIRRAEFCWGFATGTLSSKDQLPVHSIVLQKLHTSTCYHSALTSNALNCGTRLDRRVDAWKPCRPFLPLPGDRYEAGMNHQSEDKDKVTGEA